MADDVPHKGDIMAIFKRLRAIPTNKVCFDCSSKNPTWSSVTYGVFLCIDCSAVHRGLGVHVTFVRSTQLDTNWTWLQLRNMQLGGNANARKFFHQHNCSTTDAQQKYHSRAAQLYRDKLHGMAVQAMKLYGTQLVPPGLLAMAGHTAGDTTSIHIESERHDSGGDKVAEVDFFDEHSSASFDQPTLQQSDNQYSAAAQLSAHEPEPQPSKQASNGSVPVPPGAGPSVDHILGSSPTQKQQGTAPRKSTIGQRRPAGGKLGARKLGGGLGAQKVKKDFSEIEREAEQADMMKVQAAEAKKEEARQSAAEQERQLASVRLAYQDLSLEQRKQTDRVKNLDPKKAEQLERLGMGFGGGGASGGISHSAFGDMETIEQSSPAAAEPFGRRGADAFSSRRDDMDDFDFGFSTKSKSQADDNDFFGGFSGGSGLAGLSGSAGGWGKSGGASSGSWEKAPAAPPARRPPPTDTSKASCGDDAQKKFGNAKAISSAAYFGDERPSFESQQNMNRFQGARGISSADYFGEPQSSRGGGGGPMVQAPDLEDVKESVRQGVTKVAGKLGTLANGVMSSLQRKS